MTAERLEGHESCTKQAIVQLIRAGGMAPNVSEQVREVWQMLIPAQRGIDRTASHNFFGVQRS